MKDSSRFPSWQAKRRGAVLLVVLGLLSLFMLVAISFVLEASHERRGAIAAMKAEQQGDPPDALIKMGMYQVIRGSRSPNSVIGPHSLLEDIYGERDSMVGAIAQDSATGTSLGPRYVFNNQFIEITGVFFGPDRKPGQAGLDDEQPPNGIIDDVSESNVINAQAVKADDFRFGSMPLSYPSYNNPAPSAGLGLDAVEGFYAGRVLTMLTGECAKLSTRIVRYFETNVSSTATGAGSWVMWLEPFPTETPVAAFNNQTVPIVVGDTFVVNGRPFNGPGFGFNPTGSTQTYGDLSWAALTGNTGLPDGGAPFALTPNPTHPMYRDYLNDRPYVSAVGSWIPPGGSMTSLQYTLKIGVDADEDYDAPDFQNMLLAARTWVPASPTAGAIAGAGSWQVNIPSLHRPELVHYWMVANGLNPLQQGAWSQLPAGQRSGGGSFGPRLRQRIMLRPDPNDHAYTDMNNNGKWDAGEPNWSNNLLFDPINGPWDVDNDGDGNPDSVWVDLGAPVQTAADGTQFKPLFAIHCVDMDGRLNLNAHGNSTHLQFAKYNGAPTYPYLNPQYVPVAKPTGYAIITDEGNVLGMTRYHGDQQNLSNPQAWAMPVPIAGPFAASSPVNPVSPNSNPYVYNQQPNAYTPTFAAQPQNVGGVLHPQARSVGVGLGFSPAEINLAPVLQYYPGVFTGSPGYWRENRYRWLLEGRYENNTYSWISTNDMRPPTAGRYGEIHLNTNPSYATLPRPKAGITGFQHNVSTGNVNSQGDDNLPGAATALVLPNPVHPNYSPLTVNTPVVPVTGTANGMPPIGNAMTNSMYLVAQPRQGLNGSPIDPNGRLMPGLDLRGQPHYGNMPSQYSAVSGTYLVSNNELIDDPWEIDLTGTGPRMGVLLGNNGAPLGKFEIDKPLAPTDLECLLRFGDIDTWSFPRRMTDIANFDYSNPSPSGDYRQRLTTESWDIPSPNITATPEILQALIQAGGPTTNLSFGDLVRGKILYCMRNSALTPITLPQATLWAQSLMGSNYRLTQSNYLTDRGRFRALAPDLLMGLRMDLNRPFGNAYDDNGNGTVDEPLELLQGLRGVTPSQLMNFGVTIPTLTTPTIPEGMWNSNVPVAADLNWDGYINALDANARQELAKHLYTLMMLVTDTFTSPVSGTGAVYYPTMDALPGSATAAAGMPLVSPRPPSIPSPREILHAYRVAQWAVNVVDFRDRDAIMTPFEFDIRPFVADTGTSAYGTWEVDGFLSTGVTGTTISADDAMPYRGLVWGMEYPDLLITETLAFHDKAIGDSSADALGTTKRNIGGGSTPPDSTWDQIRMPQGSLFVELYCTGRPNTPWWPTPSNAPPTALAGSSYNATMYPNPNFIYYPAELYETNFNITFPVPVTNPNGIAYRQGALNLSKLCPDGTPVWRLATTKLGTSVQNTMQAQPDSACLRPPFIFAGGAVTSPTTAALNVEANMLNNYLQYQTGTSNVKNRQTVPLDRVAYFTSTSPTNITGHDFYYHGPTGGKPGLPAITVPNTANNLYLQPGCYAVAGPHRGADSEAIVSSGPTDITFAGYVATNKAFGARTVAQCFNLTSQTQSVTVANMVYPMIGHASTTTTPASNPYPSSAVTSNTATSGKIKFPLGIPLATTGTKNTMGFNISEPDKGYSTVAGYKAPSVKTNYTTPAGTVAVTDSWSPAGGAGGYPDVPFDSTANRLTVAQLKDNTLIDVCSVLLQRVADPTLPYNAYTNPYVTVDWMPIDLTVFNGQSSFLQGGSTTPQPVLTFDTYSTGATPAAMPFQCQSRQRGPRIPGPTTAAMNPAVPPATTYNGTTYPQMAAGLPYGWPAMIATPGSYPPLSTAMNGFNEAPLWSCFSDNPQYTMAVGQTSPTAASTTIPKFNHYFYSTLGFLNQGYGVVNANTYSPGAIDYAFISRVQSHYPNITTSGPFNVLYDYIGDPQRPFPWLTWNNRPYANAMELLQVPASSSDRLGWEFTYKTHYTDGIVSPLVANTAPAMRLLDNHYAPFRNLYWNQLNPSTLHNGTTTVPMTPLGGVAAGAGGTNPPSSINVFPPLPMMYGFNQNANNITTGFDPLVCNNSLLTPPGTFLNYRTNMALGGMQMQGGHPFGHLLNFFWSTSPYTPGNSALALGATSPDILAQSQAPNYYRILEYVHVPSPFSGTQKLLYPAITTGGSAGMPNTPPYGSYGVISAIPSSVGTTWPLPPATRTPIYNQFSSNNNTTGIFFPFHAPHNRTSLFREPGRVNLNTVADRDVWLSASGTSLGLNYNSYLWQGLTNDLPGSQQNWFDLLASRSAVDARGPDRLFNTGDDLWLPAKLNLYGIGFPATATPAIKNSLSLVSTMTTGAGMSANMGAYPTMFVNPFRSFSSSMYVPIPSLWNRLKMSPASGQPQAAPFLFVDSTLLRRADPDIMYGTEPVFTMNTYGWGQGLSPITANGGAAPTNTVLSSLVAAPPTPQIKLTNEVTSSYNDPNRNPFFRYYPLQKLGSVATSRSNVYAVWVTVGYFEVQKISYTEMQNVSNQKVQLSVANPDGYRLVRELNSDIGAAKRNRGFFLYDRTIPAGFIRGENLNVDNGILLRRVIQ